MRSIDYNYIGTMIGNLFGVPASVKTGTKKILFFSVHILSNPY